MARYNTIDPKVKIWLKEVFSNRDLSCKIEENLCDDQVKTERKRYHKIPDLENSVVIQEDSKNFLYIGRATELVLDIEEHIIKGCPSLTKYALVEKEKKSLQIWPPSIKRGLVIEKEKVWEVTKPFLDGHGHPSAYLPEFLNNRVNMWKSRHLVVRDNQLLIASGDKTINDPIFRSTAPFSALVDKLECSYNLILDHSLYDAIFLPIEQELLDIYKQKTSA